MEDDKGLQWLNCNIRFRSNDAWGANFMNMFGFIQFNREVIADEIARRSGKTVRLGRMNWQGIGLGQVQILGERFLTGVRLVCGLLLLFFGIRFILDASGGFI